MNRDIVQTDETGLHSVDCECVRCDAGYRPTDLERSIARRAYRLRLAEEARRKADVVDLAQMRPRLSAPRFVARPTPQQFFELKQLRKELFPCPKTKT